MKKIFSLIVTMLLVTMALTAENQVLFDYTASADVLETGYDWVQNAETVSYSGRYIPGKNLSNPVIDSNYGLSVRTDAAPADITSTFAIRFVNPKFNDGTGVGVIKNAGAVKSMDVTLTLNRGYDDITIVWYQNGRECRYKVVEKNATATVNSMMEFTAHIDFSDYISDVRNRDVKQFPAVGNNAIDIVLKEIIVTTHSPTAMWHYSPTCIVGIKRIEVDCDKAITDEAYEAGKQADEVFNVKADETLKNKIKTDIEIKQLGRKNQESLMTNSNTIDAK